MRGHQRYFKCTWEEKEGIGGFVKNNNNSEKSLENLKYHEYKQETRKRKPKTNVQKKHWANLVKRANYGAKKSYMH